MIMRDRTITVDGVDLRREFPLWYSDFQEETPQPKLFVVDIPAGSDLDITEALGPVAFHNGKHVFTFLLHSEDKEGDLHRLVSMLHGKMCKYELSWEEGCTYKGRFTVKIAHKTEEASVVTIVVDRNPWRISNVSATIYAHPTETYTLKDGKYYYDIVITLEQPATVTYGGISEHYGRGTHTLATFEDKTVDITVTLDDWWWYLDGSNLVVNPTHYTMIGSNVDFDTHFKRYGSNLVCPSEAAQYFTIAYTRKDL